MLVDKQSKKERRVLAQFMEQAHMGRKELIQAGNKCLCLHLPLRSSCAYMVVAGKTCCWYSLGTSACSGLLFKLMSCRLDPTDRCTSPSQCKDLGKNHQELISSFKIEGKSITHFYLGIYCVLMSAMETNLWREHAMIPSCSREVIESESFWLEKTLQITE